MLVENRPNSTNGSQQFFHSSVVVALRNPITLKKNFNKFRIVVNYLNNVSKIPQV